MLISHFSTAIAIAPLEFFAYLGPSYGTVAAADSCGECWPGIRHIKPDWVSAILSNVTRQSESNDTEVEFFVTFHRHGEMFKQ